MFSKALLFATAALALSACNTVNKNIATEDPYLGEAVKYDMAIQVVNPDPVYPPDAAQPGDNGDKAAQAVKRYRTDQVRQRHNSEARQGSAITTTSGSGGGNSGGGGGPQ